MDYSTGIGWRGRRLGFVKWKDDRASDARRSKFSSQHLLGRDKIYQVTSALVYQNQFMLRSKYGCRDA